MTRDEFEGKFECDICGDAIGAGEKKNVVYMCDRREGQWCGRCFRFTACGYGRHGEGCPTMVVGTP